MCSQGSAFLPDITFRKTLTARDSPATLLDGKDIVDRAIPVLRIVRHAKVERLTLVKGYPFAGQLAQIVASSWAVPGSFAGDEILSGGNVTESEVALVVRFGDADILFKAWIGWRQCEPIAQFPVDHLLGVGGHWQECDWGALSWMIFPFV